MVSALRSTLSVRPSWDLSWPERVRLQTGLDCSSLLGLTWGIPSGVSAVLHNRDLVSSLDVADGFLYQLRGLSAEHRASENLDERIHGSETKKNL